MLALLTAVLGVRAARLGAALALLVGCNNECDFTERCNGDVLEICGQGPDQMFGRRIERHPCTAPNDVCVDRHGEASCVAPALTECDPGGEPRCQGDTMVSCTGSGYEQLEPCDEAYSSCRESRYNGRRVVACLHDPEITCGEGTPSRCEGDVRLECSPAFGRLVARDCASYLGEPGAVCVTPESGSAYCASGPAD